MNRLLIAVPLLSAALLTGCKKSPYAIIDRKEQGPGGIMVMVRADVPQNASQEQMTGWCNEISKSEGEGKAVTVEFLEQGGVMRQKGVCVGGTVHPGASRAGVEMVVK